jgi:hypothetical protein
MKVLEFIVQTIGFIFIYRAVNYNREPKIKHYSTEWWAIMAMLIIGGALVRVSL